MSHIKYLFLLVLLYPPSSCSKFDSLAEPQVASGGAWNDCDGGRTHLVSAQQPWDGSITMGWNHKNIPHRIFRMRSRSRPVNSVSNHLYPGLAEGNKTHVDETGESD